jgi:hypothetical protein
MLNYYPRGINWKELWQEIRVQQKNGHPLAEHIHGLNFEKKQFSMLLEDTITADILREDAIRARKEEREAKKEEQEGQADSALFSDDEEAHELEDDDDLDVDLPDVPMMVVRR